MAGRRTDEPSSGDEAFLAWLESVPDARTRFEQATTELERHQQLVQRLSAVRATAAADFYDEGESLETIAQRLGVSRARVHQLVQEGRSRRPKPTTTRRRGRKEQDE